MQVAVRSGQPFLDLLRWHPRDLDTFYRIHEQLAEQQKERERDARFAQMREELARREGRR